MRSNSRVSRPAGCVVTCAILLSLAAAGDAAASTRVRFLHAVPGAPGADLTVAGGHGPAATVKGITFGRVSGYTTAPDGRVTLSLAAGGKKVASAPGALLDHTSYTIVAEKGKKGIEFHLYRAGKAVAGEARLRAVHAAPEVGKVEMTVGQRKWGTIDFGQATPYEQASPGSYDVAARAPGNNGSVLVEAKNTNAAAGTASTAYAVGSGGERTRIVMVEDSVAAPKGAPETGLGGMAHPAGATPWLAALLAALAAGTIGGAAYLRAPLRRSRARG